MNEMRLGALIAASALVLVSCGPADTQVRMLGPEPLTWQECFVLKKGQNVYYDANPLINDDTTPAVLDSVALVNSNRIDVRASYVVPTDRTGSGGSIVFNPATDPGWQWKGRHPVAGAIVAQDSRPAVIVLQLSTTADRASSLPSRSGTTWDPRRT